MLDLKNKIKNNTVLKITSLNAIVISVRLVISIFIQRFLAVTIGEAGIANIGQVRNLIAMVTSTSTLGVFNGIVKYVSEYKEDKKGLTQLFSTVTLFVIIGSLISGLVLGFGANYFSNFIFETTQFSYVFLALATVVPFIAINRVFNGVIHGLSKYKSYAKIDLLAYVITSMALVLALIYYGLKGAILAILIAPFIQLVVLLFVFGNILKTYISFRLLKLNFNYKNELLAFTLMSFISTFLINYIELDLRTILGKRINIEEAGYWTAMTNISKNYMVFSSSVFTLYVLPKFVTITSKIEFKKEVIHIYKTILPIFALGMLLLYVFRDVVIQIIYPEFFGMEPLFKWQLLGDFIRLSSLVIAHQFLAKKMVKSFVFTEIISLIVFYSLSILFIDYFGTEGIVIANVIRYVIYFLVVILLINNHFNSQREKDRIH